MCNHYANNPDAQALLQTWREYISWSLTDTIPPRTAELEDEIWPRREAAVVRQDVTAGGAVVDLMTWGVPLSLPGKRPGTTVTKHVTNVRNLASPFWRSMLVKPEQRCLVPFTRFAEPKMGQGRAEHWFTVTDRPVAAFAGIWRWVGGATTGGVSSPEGKKMSAFLTCEPNRVVAPTHPKAMPVILSPADVETWLKAPAAEALALQKPSPDDELILLAREEVSDGDV